MKVILTTDYLQYKKGETATVTPARGAILIGEGKAMYYNEKREKAKRKTKEEKEVIVKDTKDGESED